MISPPPEPKPSLRQRLAKALPLDLAGFSLASGIRAAIAVATPVLLGEYLGRPELAWVAIVAFWGCLVDPGGAWLYRLSVLAIFTAIAALGTLLAALVADHVVLAVAATFVWCFFASLSRVFGAAAASVALLSVTDLLVSLGIPGGNSRATFGLVVMTIAGGFWAMLLVLVLWRLYPHGPAREAVGKSWRTLGAYADSLAELHQAEEAHALLWAETMRRHRAPVREAIEQARKVMAQTRRQSGGRSERVQSIQILLVEAELCFENLVALSELLQIAAPELPPETLRGIAVLMRRIGREARAIGATLQDSRRRPPARLRAALDRFDGRIDAGFTLTQPIRALADALIRSIETSREVASGVLAPEQLGKAIAQPWEPAKPAAVIATLKDNLTWDSLYFRHALRLALTVALAEGVVAYLQIPRGYWLTMTAAVILQPFLATTWQRTLERVGGSVAGGAVAAAIGVYVTDPVWMSALVVPFSIATLAIRAVNYTLFVLCLTPNFILIAELFQQDALGSWQLALTRGLDSLVGGCFGLAAAFLLWPAREELILPKRLAADIEAHRPFLGTVLAATADPQKIQAARRAAGLASNNAEVSIQRLVGEPHSRSDHLLEPAMSIVTICRRFGGGSAALAALRQGRAVPVEAAPSAAWLDGALAQIAAAVRKGGRVHLTEPPRLDAGEDALIRELAEMLRQTDALAEAANRLAGEEEGAAGPSRAAPATE